MVRWQGNTVERLRTAATDLFLERGYDQTTVADIAERAGLTARTFFRYFTDKREVLFYGSEVLQEQMLSALAAAPESARALDAAAASIEALASVLTDQVFSRLRQSVIDAHPELQERELIKLARMGAALAGGLRERGVPDPDAGLAAQAAIAVFHVSFQRWVKDPAEADLRAILRENFAQLQRMASGQAIGAHADAASSARP